MNERDRKEHEGLAAEVAFAANFSDADRIRILRGQVYVNGAPLLEDYVAERFRDSSTWEDGQDHTAEDKPNDEERFPELAR